MSMCRLKNEIVDQKHAIETIYSHGVVVSGEKFTNNSKQDEYNACQTYKARACQSGNIFVQAQWYYYADRNC